MTHDVLVLPDPAAREVLFRDFARALFKADMDALYRVVAPDFLWSYHDGVAVTKSLTDREAIAAHLAEQKAMYATQRFYDVAYHHLPQVSFMTFQVAETLRASGEQRNQGGIEYYTFRGGRIATKDVYRKPLA
jgi:ketosteroid isomerase-like protein